MRLDWRPPTEAPYLSFGERTVLRTRLHPMVAVLPFIKVAVGTYLVLLLMGLLNEFGTILILLAFIWWVRWKGWAGNLSYGWTAGLFFFLVLLFDLGGDPNDIVYLMILIALGVAVYSLIAYFFTTIYLTDRRIFQVSGVINRVVATMPLRALTDIRYEQTLLGKTLGYGHFHVESAGQDQALSTINFVEHPQRFYRIIMSEALGDADMIPPEFLLDES